MQPHRKSTFIIPVFIPHIGCPHTCIFCNQNSITGAETSLLTNDNIISTIETYLNYANRPKIQLSFYGGTFLGLDDDSIIRFLQIASTYIDSGSIHSIRFSTRPDSITEKKLDLISPFPVETIEIGAQSMINSVLVQAGRGHSVEQTTEAVHLLKQHGYETGLQLMLGLPGDTDDSMTRSILKTIELKPDFVRLYPTIVFKGTGLETLYNKNQFSPISLDRCVTIIKKAYLRFSQNNIPIIRMGLQATEEFQSGDDLIAGPYHPAFGHLVLSELFLDMVMHVMSGLSTHPTEIRINVHPTDISKMRGLKNSNISVLKETFNVKYIKVKPDSALSINTIRIEDTVVNLTSLYNTMR